MRKVSSTFLVVEGSLFHKILSFSVPISLRLSVESQRANDQSGFVRVGSFLSLLFQFREMLLNHGLRLLEIFHLELIQLLADLATIDLFKGSYHTRLRIGMNQEMLFISISISDFPIHLHLSLLIRPTLPVGGLADLALLLFPLHRFRPFAIVLR